MVTREHPRGTTVLVLGILSLVLGLSCGIGFLLGPIAWAMGGSALREIDAQPGLYSNRSSVTAGRICGIVATVIMLVGVLGFVALVAVGRNLGT